MGPKQGRQPWPRGLMSGAGTMTNYLDDIIMPFGKYKGECIVDIPLSYLEWIYDNLELNGDLQQAVSDAIDLLSSETTRRGVVKK